VNWVDLGIGVIAGLLVSTIVAYFAVALWMKKHGL
jgi:hypothetical protein